MGHVAGEGAGTGAGGGDGGGTSEAVLQFDVVDTGIGIRDEDIARLFQPFYRVDASPTRRHGGAGLGLALSLRLAERLGGTIGARSRPEGGSAFTLTIPAGPAGTITVPPGAGNGVAAPTTRSRPGPGPATPPAAPPLAYRVLLAEDNRDTQRVMLLRLAAAGIEVTPAPNGQLAVDLALAAEEAGHPFDVILMDMQMPVLDGYEATRTLRGSGYRHPIIAVTAHAMSEDRDECLRFGCDDYLAKPIDWSRLTSLITTYANTLTAST
jgi:CheY-like chemotaxis protein